MTGKCWRQWISLFWHPLPVRDIFVRGSRYGIEYIINLDWNKVLYKHCIVDLVDTWVGTWALDTLCTFFHWFSYVITLVLVHWFEIKGFVGGLNLLISSTTHQPSGNIILYLGWKSFNIVFGLNRYTQPSTYTIQSYIFFKHPKYNLS